MTQHLWSGRFDAAPDPAAFEFGRSFPFDRRLFEDDVVGSLAWAEALEGAGVLDRADARAIRDGLTAILDEGRRNPAWVDGEDEDVHSFVERQLIARVGDAGRRLHTGRSRNEQVSLDLRLYLRRRIPVLQQRIVRLVAALVDQAARADDAVMPAYTHMRRAMPVLVAHYLLSHAAALKRDHARLAGAAEDANALPLGSGAVAGTGYAIDALRLAGRLGFDRVVTNSIDASSDRDFAVAFLHAAALTMVHLSRLAEDFILLTSEEFGFFDLADVSATGSSMMPQKKNPDASSDRDFAVAFLHAAALTMVHLSRLADDFILLTSEEFGFFDLADVSATGSSMMPQKKNPDAFELVRGKAGRVIGALTGLLVTLKGLPTGYNKDLQEDKEPVFDAEDTLAVSLDAATAVVAKVSLRRERARQAASGLLLATDVADYLVARGVPFRQAHEVVGGMVRRLINEGRSFASLSLEEWQGFHPAFAPDIHQAVTPESSVRARRTPQSTHPDAVGAVVADLGRWLSACSG